MKTKYVIECTEDNVTCTLRQHFETYYPWQNHEYVQFPLTGLYYGIIDGKIRAVPSYHKSYACLSVDEANAFMSSEALNQEIDGNISLVPDSDQKLRLIALEHAVKIGCESGSNRESVVKSAEKFLEFLNGKKETVLKYVVNGWIEVEGNEDLFREMLDKCCYIRTSCGREIKFSGLAILADITHFKIVY